MSIKFDLPKDQLSIIKVIGVGGGGSNAVNHMYLQGIKDVDFMVCNTDQQSLDQSPVPTKIQLGATLTSGLGAGSIANVGENAAIESIEDIKEILGNNTKMIFITAGMGGGTGTGAAPVIARAAKELNILTVGIVTMPFSFEGKKRRMRAEEGIHNMRESVDTLLVINNDKLREMFGNLTLDNAFEQADNVLTTAAKGIAEAITYTGKINVDFNDVRTVMTNSGVAILGSAKASGENRALVAIEEAVNSPLLNDNEIDGAAHILLNITYGMDNILMDEISEITDFIEDRAHEEAEVIWGHGIDDRLEDGEINITIVATGFQSTPDTGVEGVNEKPNRVVRTLDDVVKTELTKPIMQRPEIKQANIFEQEKVTKPKEIIPPNIQDKKEETLDANIKRINLYEEPDAKVTPVSNSDEPTSTFEVTENDNSVDNIEADKPIIRHTLEDNTFGYHEENDAKSKETNDDAPIDVEFNMEPTLKSIEEDQIEAQKEPEQAKPIEKIIIKKPEAKNHFPLENDLDGSATEEVEFEDESQLSTEERHSSIKDRMARLRNLSSMLKSPSGIANLETEPAFKRRAIDLDEVTPSSESQVSRFTLSESEDQDGDKKVDIKSNNSFLHDNVD